MSDLLANATIQSQVVDGDLINSTASIPLEAVDTASLTRFLISTTSEIQRASIDELASSSAAAKAAARQLALWDESDRHNGFVFLACAIGLLVFYLLLDSPRLFARIKSSPRLRAASSASSPASPAAHVGGQLGKGWMLRRRLHSDSDEDFGSGPVLMDAYNDSDSGHSSANRSQHETDAKETKAMSEKDEMDKGVSVNIVTPPASAESDASRRPSLIPSEFGRPPYHISSPTTWIPYAHKVLLYTPFPEAFPHATMLSLGIQSSYILLLLLTLFFRAPLGVDNADPLRAGLLATIQVPIVVGLGGRNSFVRMLFDGGHSRTIQRVHQVVGRLVVLCIFVHVFVYIRKWARAGTFITASKTPFIVWGYVAVAATLLIVISSLPIIRRKAHRVFKVCHHAGILALLIGLGKHIKVIRPYVGFAAGLYALNCLMRFAKGKLAVAELTECGDSTMIRIPGLTGWRAGQYVMLRVPALGVHGLESHPFTIASAPDTDEGLLLIAKSSGDWTKRLRNLSGGIGRAEAGTRSYRARVILEGPHGGMGHAMLASYSSALIIAGGSGITHALGLVKHLLSSSANTQLIDFVWIVRTADIARPIMPKLARLSDPRLRVHIYVSRCPVSSPLDLPFASSPETFAGIRAHTRRPDLSYLLEDTVTLTSGTDGVAVSVCGPDSLVLAVRAACRRLPESKRVAVGGVDLMEETFAF